MENQIKINFFKKIWWSITNVNKYDEMAKLGFKKAIKYFVGIIAILALILSIVGTYIQSKSMNELIQYFQDNIPEFKLTKKDNDYNLDLEKDETVILDAEIFTKAFKNIVVMNETLNEEDAVKEYSKLANNEKKCLIFLKDKCILVTQNEGEVTKYKYTDLLNQYTGSNNDEYNKTSVLNYFGNISYMNYIMLYFINYFVMILIVFIIDIVIVGALSILFAKVLKIDIDKKSIYSVTTYALTLPAILYIAYLIINYFTNIYFAYINVANMLIAYIYIIIYFMKKRKNILQYNK